MVMERQYKLIKRVLEREGRMRKRFLRDGTEKDQRVEEIEASLKALEDMYTALQPEPAAEQVGLFA